MNGPGYLRLNEQEMRELGRLHQNLGHPDTGIMVKFLSEHKADPRIIQGAKDFSCSTCLESVSGPKPARPAAIHVDADFGDVIGMDVAYWSWQSGHKYMFTHILDEATLFHQATASGRTMEDQYDTLTDSWTKWAGHVVRYRPLGRNSTSYSCQQTYRCTRGSPNYTRHLSRNIVWQSCVINKQQEATTALQQTVHMPS